MYKIVIIIIVIILIVYLYTVYTDRRIKRDVEKFTALSGLHSPLATYDDYGTFNLIFHHNDLPYYDPKYHHMCRAYENYYPDTDPVEFIKYDGNNKLRRKLIGANYTDYIDFRFHPTDPVNAEPLWDPLRPEGPTSPPKPANWYFEKL